MFSLEHKQIHVEKVITSPISFSFVIPQDHLKTSKDILCGEFLDD